MFGRLPIVRRATVAAAILSILGTSCGLVSLAPAATAAACSFSTPSPLPSADYLIETAADLQWLHDTSTEWSAPKVWTQTADIDMGGCEWTSAGFGTTSPFSATYNGGGFAITGVDITLPTSRQYGGLFARLTGTVKNLRYSGNVLPATGTSGQSKIGGIVGLLSSGGTLQNVGFSGSVKAPIYVGGLVGEVYNGSISGSFSTGSVSDNGGRTDTYVGGLVGYGNDMDISNSFSTSQVSARDFGGGLVGAYVLTNNTLSDSYSAGPFIFTGTTSTAFGGVTGGNNATGMSDNFWSTDAPGTNATQGNGGSTPDTGTTGKTSAELQTLSTFQSASWDIASGWTDPNGGSPVTWGICANSNDGYPFLNSFFSTDPCSSGGGESSSPSGGQPLTFTFQLPGGGECPAISPQYPRIYTWYTLPDADAPCFERDSVLTGWRINGQDWAFEPGRKVWVIDSQVFTAVLEYNWVRIDYDSNVAVSDQCLAEGEDLPTVDRTAVTHIPREIITQQILWDAPVCTPLGYEFVGWTDRRGAEPRVLDPKLDLMPAPAVDTDGNAANQIHLYAAWKLIGAR